MIRLASLFDGIGGTPLCASMCGAECVWASEIEPFPIKVTKHHFPNMKHYGDITKINGADVEPVNIIVGGSPCQDLSVAGKRAGLAGGRSGLFMEQIRIIKEMRSAHGADYPRFMVWENVPGAFSSNDGEDFRAVLEETARIADPAVSIPRSVNGWANAGSILGNEFSLSWRIIDAQYWGVPQRRRRIYLVADFRGQSAPKILFEREGLSRNSAESRGEGERAAGDASKGPRTTILNDQGGGVMNVTYDQTGTLRAQEHGHQPCVCYGFKLGNSEQARSIGLEMEKSPTLNAECGGNKPAIFRSDKENGDLCGTLQAKPNGGFSINCIHPVRVNNTVRRLTPLEAERLQGYPDNWTNIPGTSDSARYKALGNSFAIPCAFHPISGCVEEMKGSESNADKV